MTANIFRIMLITAIAVGFMAMPALAQQKMDDAVFTQQVDLEKSKQVLWKPLVAIGAGLVTLGGALGIGRLAAAAMEGTARQPEAGGDIRTSMIIAAALIEGFTFFALVVCIIAT